MNNLIIIGNGFDLAHNLKTKYQHFIDHVLDSHFNNHKKYSHLINVINRTRFSNRNMLLQEIKKSGEHGFRSMDVQFVNQFFQSLLVNYSTENWCDIEQLYYDKLNKSPDSIKAVKTLNKQFSAVKKSLEEYISEIMDDLNVIESYKYLFNNVYGKTTRIVNFNYTKTLDRYFLKDFNQYIINIHGQIFDNENPIIFGYAPKKTELDALIKLGKNEYLKNIKQVNYLRWCFDRKLMAFLIAVGPRTLNVFVLGHSLGISDELLLSDILNHRSVKSIRLFYHENFESYFDGSSNMKRIMGEKSETSILNLLSYNESMRMPQYNDDLGKIKQFKEYLNNVLKIDKESNQYPIV